MIRPFGVGVLSTVVLAALLGLGLAQPVSAVDIERTEAAESQAGAAPAAEAPVKHSRRDVFLASLTIFVLAIFVGFEVITKVPPTLQTPLMSGSNAISGITVVGSLLVATGGYAWSSWIGFFAVIMAMINVVGGFLVTHRMLAMFKKR